jgi:hypothetical protein
MGGYGSPKHAVQGLPLEAAFLASSDDGRLRRSLPPPLMREGDGASLRRGFPRGGAGAWGVVWRALSPVPVLVPAHSPV